MTTLYRKYRPQTFHDLAGQEFIVETIMNEVAAGTVAHAYLFAGPRGVGKTTMARLLAKAVNCEKRKDGSSEPCNECASCTEIMHGRHIDVMEIDAASQTGVDNVRENIIENAQFKPTKSKFKVFIVDEVHMLSTSAFNALLKILEEPPAHIIFILATTELHKLPATVISRCQRFQFKRIPYDTMLATLKDICKAEEVKVDEEVLTRIIAKSDGGMRDAESVLGQVLSLGAKKIIVDDVALVLPPSDIENVLELFAHLAHKQAAPALTLVQKMVSDGLNLDQFMLDCLDTLRTILLEHAAPGSTDTSSYSKEQFKKIKELTTTLSDTDVTKLIEAFLRRRLELRTSPILQLPLEVLIVQFCSTQVQPESSTSAPTAATKHSTVNKAPAPASAPESPPTIEKITTASPPSEPDKPSLATAIGHAITSSVSVTADQIKQKWDDIIKKIGETNHSLTFVMKMCQIKEVGSGGLHLSVPYSLHKEKLEEPKSRRVIEDTLQALFAERIPIFCSVEANQSPSNDLSDVAASFGGEIVN